jgi:glyceraldehyde 3-phosphate dehydrogenase
MNIAINGFGRIGRATLKAILAKGSPKMKIVAINDLTDTATLAHLLRYDSCYGIYDLKVSATKNALVVDGQSIPVYAEKDPALLPWRELEVDVVMECTGLFRNEETAGKHLKAGAKKVIISAPASGKKIKTIVMGVNEEMVKLSDHILSNASCTTNCLSPVTKVIEDNFGIKKAMMTTIHSYTADQNLIDAPHKDLRRARAAALSMVPTTTGAAVAVTETIPSLKDKFDGMAVRVPTPVASLVDMVCVTKKRVDEKMVNEAFVKAAKSAKLKPYLAVSNEELVSCDYIGNSYSSIVDLPSTKVVDGDLLKVVAWYDNEWGYSCRMADLAEYLMKKKFIK